MGADKRGTPDGYRVAVWRGVGGAFAMAAAGTLVAVAVPPARTALAAGSTMTTMGVQATIAASCTFSTTAVNFGVYDPLADGDAQAQGAVTLTCTGGTVPTVSLGAGQQAANVGSTQQEGGAISPAVTSSGVTITRAMLRAGNRLGYDLFADTSLTTVWNNTNKISPGEVGTGQPVVLPIYGAIPAKQTQTLGGGAYTDTVLVTVTWP